MVRPLPLPYGPTVKLRPARDPPRSPLRRLALLRLWALPPSPFPTGQQVGCSDIPHRYSIVRCLAASHKGRLGCQEGRAGA